MVRPVKMSCVHYKFYSKLDYNTVTFDGLYITLSELKKQIMGRERLKATDCDLQITNAQTQEGTSPTACFVEAQQTWRFCFDCTMWWWVYLTVKLNLWKNILKFGLTKRDKFDKNVFCEQCFILQSTILAVCVTFRFSVKTYDYSIFWWM